MKKSKLKMEKYENDEVKLIKNLAIILVVVIVFALGFYFLTDKFVTNEKITDTNVEFNYDVATVGTILNRPYDEYLVLLYDLEDSESAYYSTLLSNYNGDDKIYFVDLSLKYNKEYVSEKSSGVFENVTDAKFSGPTLLKIKDGKVISFLDTKEGIQKELKNKNIVD